MTIRKLSIILGVLLAITISVLFVIIYIIAPLEMSVVEQKIVVEISKALIQLIVVIVIGSAVAVLFKALEQGKKEEKEVEQRFNEERKLRANIRIEYLSRVGMAYRNAKSTRRTLRAAGLTTKFGKPPIALNDKQLEIYKNEMKILNCSQLELEALKIEAASLPALLNLDKLSSYLASMEKYLRKVVKEFERENAAVIHGKQTVEFSDLEKLSEFTESIDKNRLDGFELNLATPHDNVISLISENTYDDAKS